jgi:uncharacterized lipoprotein YmbA
VTALRRAGLLCSFALCGCVGQADHFYALNTVPDASNTVPDGARVAPAPSIQVRLQVTIPSMVDRNEMVLHSSRNGIEIFDHERWAAPLADQVYQTLARDLEGRRSDVLVGDRGFDRAAAPPVKLKVDIVRMSAQRGGRAGIETHWRIVDSSTGVDEMGSGSFEATITRDDYAAVAQAYSQALSDLAERLAERVPRR